MVELLDFVSDFEFVIFNISKFLLNFNIFLVYLMTLNMLNASSVAKGSQYGKAK